MRTIDIAICGSGIGGLAAAVALQAHGHRVTLFEKVDAPRPIGSGLVLQPTGQAALAHLGLLEAAASYGRRLDGIAGKTSTGRTIFDIGYNALGTGIHGFGIHRGALFHILNDARESLEIPVTTSADIAASAITADKRLVTDASGGPRGAFDLVVDATGLHSPLRRAHARVTLNRPYAYGAVWGVVHEPSEWAYGRTLAQCYDGAEVMIGLLPIGTRPGDPQPLVAFFWSLRADAFDAWRASGFSAWQDRVTALWPAAAPCVTQFSGHADLVTATYADIWLASPVAERLAFIGDSARAASPQLGQGANLALIDAVVLADSLAKSRTVDEALAAYAQARRAHTRFYGLASRWLTPFFQSDSRLAGLIRDTTFAPMARIPYLRREMVRTLTGVKTGVFSHQAPDRFLTARSTIPDFAGASRLPVSR